MKVTNHSKRQRERILLALANGPLSNIEIADRLFLNRRQSKEHLDKMLATCPRSIHIAGYRKNSAGGRPTILYGVGDLPDAVFEPSRFPKRHLINGQNDAHVLALLETGSMTASQIANRMGKHISQARRIIARLRAANRIHVCDWVPLPKSAAARYALGNLPDVERVESLPEKRIVRHAVRKTGWAAALGL